MDKEVIKLYKNLGETPLECIERFRAQNPDYKEKSMTYLGRLDPMAEGLLLVLAGNTRDKEKYLGWDKTYEFEVLWGIETDTYDTLGLVTDTGPQPQKLDMKMGKLLNEIMEKKTQSYPPFSSKMFKGNFLSAREGRVEEVKVVDKGIKIFDMQHIHTKLLDSSDILHEIVHRVNLVKGDFRQKEILEKWNFELERVGRERFLVSKFKADVSSGTYIRSLAHEMGKKLGTTAIAYSIRRTRVGEYST
ncbi:MAG: pseudouridine synthase family protein [Minisyncoccota bacterium]